MRYIQVGRLREVICRFIDKITFNQEKMGLFSCNFKMLNNNIIFFNHIFETGMEHCSPTNTQ